MSEVRWLGADEQRAWRAFLSATRLLFDKLERELHREAGMPHAYYEVLARLSEAPDRVLRMSELAHVSQSSRSRLSHAVARLEEAGLVRRKGSPTDRRGSFTVLTDKGLAALESAAPVHVEGVRSHLFDQLTPEQVTQLHTISEAIVDHLAAARGSTGPASTAPVDWLYGTADGSPAVRRYRARRDARLRASPEQRSSTAVTKPLWVHTRDERYASQMPSRRPIGRAFDPSRGRRAKPESLPAACGPPSG